LQKWGLSVAARRGRNNSMCYEAILDLTTCLQHMVSRDAVIALICLPPVLAAFFL